MKASRDIVEIFSFKQLAEQDVIFEKRIRQQLARQAAAHSDHLKEVLKVQVCAVIILFC